MVQYYKKRNILICWVKLKGTIRQAFLNAELITYKDLYGNRGNIFDSIQDAVQYIQNAADKCELELEVYNSVEQDIQVKDT